MSTKNFILLTCVFSATLYLFKSVIKGTVRDIYALQILPTLQINVSKAINRWSTNKPRSVLFKKWLWICLKESGFTAMTFTKVGWRHNFTSFHFSKSKCLFDIIMFQKFRIEIQCYAIYSLYVTFQIRALLHTFYHFIDKTCRML